MIDHSFGCYGMVFFGIILTRYFGVAEGTYWFFYSPLGQLFLDHNLQNWSPSWQSLQRDIKLSVLSAGVFVLVAAFIMSGYRWGTENRYTD